MTSHDRLDTIGFGARYNIGNLSESYIQPKSLKISLVHNFTWSRQILLNFYADHSNHKAVLCENLQKEFSNIEFMDKGYFVRFHFQTDFG